MLSEVPQKVRKLLGLPDRDQGIDIVAETKSGKYWAIQCKYRGTDNGSLTWREISTFTGLTFGICKNIEFGLIAYTGERYTKVLDTAEHIAFLSSDTWSTLGDDFFKKLSKALIGKSEPLKPRTPRPHQKRAIQKAKDYFADKKNTRGKLIMPCGTGKSLTGFWLAEELGAKTIVVAVPSLALIQQTLPVWVREYAARGKNKMQWLCVCSDQTVTENTDSVVVHTQDLGYPCLTNKDEIKAWLKETAKATPRVVFTTYQSGKVIAEALRESKTKVDLGIMDEAHKTVGQKDRLFSHLLFDQNLPIQRRVFMTATERRYAGKDDEVISMDDPLIYGETFELLSFKDALEQKPPILSDYKVITMVISQKEVAKLITENRYVRPAGSNWSEEVEAQILASLIAYRKAAEKYPIKHAVSFHSSIARARAFKDFNDIYTDTQKGQKLETFHVTGAMPTATRKQIISDFAKAKHALITNARCLTEGVDVPNIDCVVFADPKQSTIDIVQAVGRALRPSEGKKYGYILVPVVTPGEDAEEFISSEAFGAVMTVLRALGANDERIIEHFRAIHNGRRIKGGTIEIDMDEKISLSIDLEKFAEQIETKVWGRLAQLSWRPYSEARAFAHTLNLKSRKEWMIYAKLPSKPADIPASPPEIYPEFNKEGGWGTWLGTGRVHNVVWLPYEEAAKFVQKLGLKNQAEWNDYCRGKRKDLPLKPRDIPKSPYSAYGPIFAQKGGMFSWLGGGRRRGVGWRSYDEAVKFVHKLGLKGQTDWQDYCRGKLKKLPPRPNDIPISPERVYQDVFQDKGGWGAWFGTGFVAMQKRVHIPYKDAVKFSLSLSFKSKAEWNKYCKGEMKKMAPKPQGIPSDPQYVYGKEFKINGGWSAWLGTKNRKGGWMPYPSAVKFVHTLNLLKKDEWDAYCKGERPDLPPKPSDIPISPAAIYKTEFYKNGGVGGWLGTNTGRGSGNWQSYDEAVKFVHKLKLRNEREWRVYKRGGMPSLPPKPMNIPSTPDRVYGNLFKKRGSYRGWLGVSLVAKT